MSSSADTTSRCPSCKTLNRVKPGTTVKCGRCGSIFVVPGRAITRGAQATRGARATPPSRQPRKPLTPAQVRGYAMIQLWAKILVVGLLVFGVIKLLGTITPAEHKQVSLSQALSAFNVGSDSPMNPCDQEYIWQEQEQGYQTATGFSKPIPDPEPVRAYETDPGIYTFVCSDGTTVANQ